MNDWSVSQTMWWSEGAYTVSETFVFQFTTISRAQMQREENARLRRETVTARSGFSAWERQTLA